MVYLNGYEIFYRYRYGSDMLIDYIGMYTNLTLSTIHIIPILSNMILSNAIISNIMVSNTKLCTAMMPYNTNQHTTLLY